MSAPSTEVLFYLTLTAYYDPSPQSREVVANSISSFRKFLNNLKGCNTGVARSLIPVEPIFDDTPTDLPSIQVTVTRY